MPIVAAILIVGGAAALLAAALTNVDRPVPDHQPDLPPDAPPPAGFPKSTRFRLVDKILPLLKTAADASGIPLGLLVGWIAKESGGKLTDVTSRGERGYFQLDPSESKNLVLDHERLSTDQQYSIDAGIKLIRSYMPLVESLGVAARGSTFYYLLIKLCHTMGDSATKKIVAMAQQANAAHSWQTLRDFVVANEQEILHATKHSPTKWFHFIDSTTPCDKCKQDLGVYQVGAPFGFGSGQAIVGGVIGGRVYDDIVDPLDAIRA